MSTQESMCLHLFESSQGHQFIHSFRTATCRTKSTGSLERLFPETCLQRIFFVHRVFFRPLVSFISSHSSAGSIAELTDGPVSSFAFGWPRGWYQLCKGGFRFPAFSDSLSISSNPGKRCRASSTGPLDGACRHMAKSRSGWASRLHCQRDNIQDSKKIDWKCIETETIVECTIFRYMSVLALDSLSQISRTSPNTLWTSTTWLKVGAACAILLYDTFMIFYNLVYGSAGWSSLYIESLGATTHSLPYTNSKPLHLSASVPTSSNAYSKSSNSDLQEVLSWSKRFFPAKGVAAVFMKESFLDRLANDATSLTKIHLFNLTNPGKWIKSARVCFNSASCLSVSSVEPNKLQGNTAWYTMLYTICHVFFAIYFATL